MSTDAPSPAAPARRPAGKKGKKKKGRTAAAAAAVTSGQSPWIVASVVAAGLIALTVWAWPPRAAPEPHVARGNERYGQQRYSEALAEYESAPSGGARNAGVHLDRGLAHYRTSVPASDAGGLPLLPPDASLPSGYTQAQEELRTAARGGTGAAPEDVDAFFRARAQYDLGNTYFTQRSWDNAITAYKDALRLRPGWRDAAWNLELARRLREEERNPPDAGHDAGQDAAQDAQPDAPDGNAGDASGGDGSSNRDGGGDGGGNQPDSGGNQPDGGGSQPDSGANQPDSGRDQDRDAGPPPGDAQAPRSMAPLDDLDRTSRSLQEEMMRRRGLTPRGPDDDR